MWKSYGAHTSWFSKNLKMAYPISIYLNTLEDPKTSLNKVLGELHFKVFYSAVSKYIIKRPNSF